MKYMVDLALAASALVPVAASAAPTPVTPPPQKVSTPTTSSASKPTQLDPASLALARQILTIAYPPDKREQMFDSITNAMRDQSRASLDQFGLSKDKDFQALIDDQMADMFQQMKVTIDEALPDYFESMARAYARGFSADDLKGILAFAKTPEGQHFLARGPMLINDPDVRATSARMDQKLLGRMSQLMSANMQRVKDYVAKKTADKPATKPVT